MEPAIAREKHRCAACGGDAHWNPAKAALVCPYCGAVAPGTHDVASGEVREHDLAATLRDIPEQDRGWKAEKISVKCRSCQAISVLDPARVGQRCDFCGAAQLVPYEQTRAPIRPESLLAFRVPESTVRDSIRAWYGNRWLAPNSLNARALTDTLRGIYIPYWTFDASAQADWTADSGYYYYTTETYRDANGRTQTRNVRQIRWESSSGSVDHFFDDALIPGTKGVHEGLLRGVEPFPTQDLVPYDSSFLAGWVVEQYQVDLTSAAQRSQQEMESQLRGLCAAQVPGDTHRNLQVSARFSGRTFKHILCPVWLVTYVYGSRCFQVVVNGYTGEIAGEYPKSWVKIVFLVLGILALAVGAALLSRS